MADNETKTTTKKPVEKSSDKKAAAVSGGSEKVGITTPPKEDKTSTTPPVDKLPAETTKASPTTAPASSDDNQLITEPAAAAAPAASGQTTPGNPVVITENEVKKATENEGGGKRAEEIEVLTGEIQALEAKIEQLTNGATSAPAEVTATALGSSDVAPINAPQAPAIKEDSKDQDGEKKKNEAPDSLEPMKIAGTSDSSEKDFVNKPQEPPKSPSSAVGSAKIPNRFNDISAKPKPNEKSTDLNPASEGKTDSGSGLAIIGEVIAVFGIIIFIILAISPFFKEIIGNDTYQAVQQIGWLSSIGSLGLGLILYMFVKGSVLFKVLIFILLLMAIVLFLAINENPLLSPILGYLDPLLDFYR